ncbi:3-isopropylmalate dehydrogenase [Pullulanibacillus pueri]|uniref:3-isopropylmalate dehydrogenase n=1 Tax=Pullulanibacillus pueri TaxID=1437324 RepID=A0A8J2ZX76_9BACL|nr:3-isopropylmalate dehydrogenase [Pullulanibacillus pueri]MBM7683565.1 3-isopropylmalate dehydrogenase [Pullulanibacillus pueri]GGH84453.1 3-isopropylmalate dehydrogenase [Pullulanibacillus pueri]
MKKRIALLPGDGIGPEVMAGCQKVLEAIAERFNHEFLFEEGKIGGGAIDAEGTPLPEQTVALCEKSDAILLGAVGGPKWDDAPSHLRPEKGLLGIRKKMGLFANLRPVSTVKSLIPASPLKEEVVSNVDLLIVRELTGGIYFGQPSGREGDKVVDTLEYTKQEIERIVRKGFELASVRRGKLTSVDKANVLESSKVWRETVNRIAPEFPDVEVEHQLVDSAAMQLIRYPEQFDVIVTENLFGDILSDEASMLTGSLGMLPSASLRSDGFGMYEPVHGSAPDIAGKGIANPLAMIMSAAMMLRYTFNLFEEAQAIEVAVQHTLEEGYHTKDLVIENGQELGTEGIIEKVIEQINEENTIKGILETYS